MCIACSLDNGDHLNFDNWQITQRADPCLTAITAKSTALGEVPNPFELNYYAAGNNVAITTNGYLDLFDNSDTVNCVIKQCEVNNAG